MSFWNSPIVALLSDAANMIIIGWITLFVGLFILIAAFGTYDDYKAYSKIVEKYDLDVHDSHYTVSFRSCRVILSENGATVGYLRIPTLGAPGMMGNPAIDCALIPFTTKEIIQNHKIQSTGAARKDTAWTFGACFFMFAMLVFLSKGNRITLYPMKFAMGICVDWIILSTILLVPLTYAVDTAMTSFLIKGGDPRVGGGTAYVTRVVPTNDGSYHTMPSSLMGRIYQRAGKRLDNVLIDTDLFRKTSHAFFKSLRTCFHWRILAYTRSPKSRRNMVWHQS